jgi:hypothetical protein
MRNKAGETPRQKRFRAYVNVSKGHYRKVIPACWLFSIRLHHPGGEITGYLPPGLDDMLEDEN